MRTLLLSVLLGTFLTGGLSDKPAGAAPPATTPYVWRSVTIGGGGFVPGIVFSPTQPGLIYARTDIGGAYRWEDSTRHWIPLTDWVSQADSNLLGIESIGLDPTDANRVYLAAGTYTQSWAGNGAILRSQDQGRTWQRTDLPFKLGGNEDGRSLGERLAVDPHRDKILFFGSRKNGLWRSADYGASWQNVSAFPVNGPGKGIGIGFILFDPRGSRPGQPTQTLYAGVAEPGTGLYCSRDAGITWEFVPGQPAGLLPHHGALTSRGTLILTYGNAPGPNGMSDGAVWKYDTQTEKWTDITPLKPSSAGGFGYAGLALDRQHPGTIMVCTMDHWWPGDTIFRTTDGGAHWSDLKPKAVRDSSTAPFLNWGGKTAALGHWMGSIAIDPFHPGHVLYGTGATIWGSDDADAADQDAATHWTVRTQGMEETAVISLVSPPSGAHLISALGDIGGFRHDDLTVSPQSGVWTNPLINSTDGLAFAENDPRLVVRVGDSGPGKRGAYSLDGAATWTPFSGEPPGGKGSGAIAVSTDGGTFVWSPRDSPLFYSRDRGATWAASAGVPAKLVPIADRVNPRKFYACDRSAGTLYLSADGGATFSLLPASFPSGDGRLWAAPGREGDLWLTTGDHGLYHSPDGGTTLSKVDSVSRAYALGFGHAAPGQTSPALYLTGKVGDVTGVFRSDDSGVNWTRINDGAHQYGWVGQTITGDPRLFGRVYLGTNGRGILYADPARP